MLPRSPVGRFPGGALITVANFARPGLEVEIPGIATPADIRN